ncbi:MAG: S8 family peptidase [Nitrososphaerota archaeon]|jgi:subtilisin family serine protease|nr:S8 family peptidase [Nitrososphaerota archaeon]
MKTKTKHHKNNHHLHNLLTITLLLTLTTTTTIITINPHTPQPHTNNNTHTYKTPTITPTIHTPTPLLLTQNTTPNQPKQNPNTTYITTNTQTQTTKPINWATQQINATTAWTQSTGTNIKIAILDTGIAPINDLKIHGGYNFIDNNTNTTDQNGHGTMIASIIATQPNSTTGLTGIAPNAQIYALKALNDQGIGTLDQAIAAVEWAIENNMHIISISWCINDENNALKQALDSAYNKGILIVAAAGNAGEIASGVGCPAGYNTTIAVSATKEDNRKLEQACTGPEIELAAPGENIYAIGPDNKLNRGTGTSYATAYVTGTAALVWAKNPTLTNTQVRNILCQTATDLQPTNGLDRDIFFGYGLINATAAVQATPYNTNPTITHPPNTNTPKTTTNLTNIHINLIIGSTITITILSITYYIIKNKNAHKHIIDK